MAYHPYVWPFVLSAFVAGLVLQYAWRRRAVPASRSFLVLTALAGTWSLFSAASLLTVGFEAKLWITSLRYVIITTLPVAWLVFAAAHTQQRRLLRPRRIAGLLAVPFVTLALVATNTWHGLMFALSWLDASGPTASIARLYGPWFWVHTAYSYVLLAAGGALLLRHWFHGPRLYRQQARLMLFGAATPFLLNAVFLTAPSRFGHLDPTPIGFTLAGVLFAWGLYRFRLLDLAPAARAAVVESLPDGVAVLDGRHRIVDLNPAAAQLFGVPLAEALGRPLATLSDDFGCLYGQPELPAAEVIERFAGGERRFFEWSISGLDDYQGRRSGLLVLVLRDVTERRRAATFERAQRHLLEMIAQGLPLPAVLSAVARFTEETASAPLHCLITLLDEAAGTLRPIAAPSLPETVVDALATIPWAADACSCGAAAFHRTAVEAADLAHDAGWRPYAPYLLLHGLSACRAVPLFSSDDRVLGTLSLFYDRLRQPTPEDRRLVETATHLAGIAIERRRFVEDLIAAKEKAEEMARLKSVFLANMSHEIRTPLTAIIGFSEILAQELEDEYQHLAARIGQGGNRLLATLNSVLDFARLEAGKVDVQWEVLDVCELAEETVAVFRAQAEAKGLAFELDAPPRPALARLDRGLLGRVLNNLVENALKFTKAGHVTLRVHATPTDVVIAVADSGVGIDEAFMPYLFDEFRQESSGLSRSHEGSGLGLRITRQIVQQMQGTIAVASRKQEGATFTVRFARHREAVPPRPARPRDRTAEPERTPTGEHQG